MIRGHSYAINVSPDILTWCYAASQKHNLTIQIFWKLIRLECLKRDIEII